MILVRPHLSGQIPSVLPPFLSLLRWRNGRQKLSAPSVGAGAKPHPESTCRHFEPQKHLQWNEITRNKHLNCRSLIRYRIKHTSEVLYLSDMESRSPRQDLTSKDMTKDLSSEIKVQGHGSRLSPRRLGDKDTPSRTPTGATFQIWLGYELTVHTRQN